MQIIDGQLHEIGPSLKWEKADTATKRGVLTEVILGWMDAVGVDATVVVPFDPDWLKEVIVQVPDRLAGIFRVRDPEAADVEEQVAEGRKVQGSLGHRLSFGKLPNDPTGEMGAAKFKSGAFNRFFAACEKYNRPLFCSAYGFPDLVGEIAKTHPGLRVVVDHMGIAQPPMNPREAPPWRALPDLLALAHLPNVFVKLCGAPVLSDESFPYKDVWPHVHQIIEKFGVKRVLWASDIGRFEGRISWDNKYSEAHGPYVGKHNYADALFFILHTNEISQAEKEELLGGTIRRLTGWNPKPRR